MACANKRISPIVVGMMALVIALGLFAFAQQAQAADYSTGNSNQLDTTAVTSVKKVVKGTMKSGTKVTRTFTMPNKGYVVFNVSLPKGLGVTTVNIDSSGARYLSTSVINGDASGNTGKFRSGRFSFKPGAKVRVTLEYRGISKDVLDSVAGGTIAGSARNVLEKVMGSALSGVTGSAIAGATGGTLSDVAGSMLAGVTKAGSSDASGTGHVSTQAATDQPVPYTITMSAKAPKRYECEQNNKRATANTIKVHKTYSGNIITHDVDWFVFKAPKAGTYKVAGKVLPPGSSLSASAAMAVYHGSKEAGVRAPLAGKGYEKLASVQLQKGQRLFIKVVPVSAALLLGQASTDYTVKVVRTK